jgi:hypothetical protein
MRGRGNLQELPGSEPFQPAVTGAKNFHYNDLRARIVFDLFHDPTSIQAILPEPASGG